MNVKLRLSLVLGGAIFISKASWAADLSDTWGLEANYGLSIPLGSRFATDHGAQGPFYGGMVRRGLSPHVTAGAGFDRVNLKNGIVLRPVDLTLRYYFYPESPWTNFLQGGLGAASGPGSKAFNDLSAKLGVGFEYYLGARLALGAQMNYRYVSALGNASHETHALTAGFFASYLVRARPAASAPPPLLDSDKDGINDVLDNCPDTPAGLPVDEKGCPPDSDKDGVPDYLDRCAGTPREAVVPPPMKSVMKAENRTVDIHLDIAFDKRGFVIKPESFDDLDLVGQLIRGNSKLQAVIQGFPDPGSRGGRILAQRRADAIKAYFIRGFNIPAGRLISQGRIPTRKNRGGAVSVKGSYIKNIPASVPMGEAMTVKIVVDKQGCPQDSDGDSIPDYVDKCPDTLKGLHVNSEGCALALKPGELLSVTLLIEFGMGQVHIEDRYRPEFEKIADFMRKYPMTKASIEGHTDATGSEKFNVLLSLRRAKAVRRYLIHEFGIQPGRLTYEGYGYFRPIAPNDAESTRQRNRRVLAIFSTDSQ